jgi:hypothetical protein
MWNSRRVTFGIALLIIASSPLSAQSHESRFELTEAFLTDWAHHPVRDVEVKLACAGPIHPPQEDCEIHIGAQLSDPSISDFQDVVLEPPSVCEEPDTDWGTFINTFKDQDCVGRGFVRVWPEHLSGPSFCSNPNHFMEVHPLQTLKCGNQQVLDFTSKLRVVEDLGFKPATTVRLMMDLKLWVCEECQGAVSEGGLTAVEFDYCFGKRFENCTRPPASNFARFQVRVIRSTIRPKEGASLEGFATVIARVLPINTNGRPSGTRQRLLKLYALEGSDFYDKLLAMRGETGAVKTLDIIGIFSVDPFSVLKVIEKPDFPHGEWVSVPFPVSLVVFGET